MLEDHFWDMDGEPIDVWTWSHLYKDKEARTLGRDTVGDRSIVTVWLGHDEERWTDGRDDPPRIFGTAVLSDAGTLLHEVRATTRQDAEINHQLVLESQRTQHQMRQAERVEHGYDER